MRNAAEPADTTRKILLMTGSAHVRRANIGATGQSMAIPVTAGKEGERYVRNKEEKCESSRIKNAF
mgnify:CR=1 FL=1